MDKIVLNQIPQPRSAAYKAPRWAGPNYPLRNDFMIALVVDDHAVNAGLYLLLMTEPGERLNEPDVGVALRVILFEPGTPGLIDEIQRKISIAIARFEPRIVIAEPGISVSIEEENDSTPTGAVYFRVAFRWAFKSDLSSKFDFSTILFRADPAAQKLAQSLLG